MENVHRFSGLQFFIKVWFGLLVFNGIFWILKELCRVTIWNMATLSQESYYIDLIGNVRTVLEEKRWGKLSRRQWSNWKNGRARGGLAHLKDLEAPHEMSVLRGFKGACKRPPEIAR